MATKSPIISVALVGIGVLSLYMAWNGLKVGEAYIAALPIKGAVKVATQEGEIKAKTSLSVLYPLLVKSNENRAGPQGDFESAFILKTTPPDQTAGLIVEVPVPPEGITPPPGDVANTPIIGPDGTLMPPPAPPKKPKKIVIPDYFPDMKEHVKIQAIFVDGAIINNKFREIGDALPELAYPRKKDGALGAPSLAKLTESAVFLKEADPGTRLLKVGLP